MSKDYYGIEIIEEDRRLDLEYENYRLRKALAFAACTIKSGEGWSETCEKEIGDLLKEEK